MEPEISRRPLKTREQEWPRRLAFGLVRLGLTPNQISVASVGFSALGAVCLLACQRYDGRCGAALFTVAAICIQLRLLCNLVDGLMAVEAGFKTKTGEMFNEFPDRAADVMLLIAAGYSIRWDCSEAVELGYLCAIASLVTAYVRVFGGSAGLRQDFCGPMAKPHRMAALTIACLLSAGEAFASWDRRAMLLGLAIILIGTVFTAVRRTFRISHLLNAR